MSDFRFDVQATGEWFGGDTAATRPVHFSTDGDALLISSDDGAEIARWPIASLRVDASPDRDVVHIESGNELGLAVTRDLVFVARLRAVGARGTARPRGKRALLVALACGAGVVAIFGGLYAGAPWLSQRIAEQVPLSAERHLNAGMGGILAKNTCDTEQARTAIRALKSRLDPTGSIPATIRVTDLSLTNAFSLPGGDVLLTRALVEQAESPDEIAGVLAHELAHVRHRHVLAQLIENTFLSSLWAATFGDYSGLLVADPATVYRLLTLRHSRAAESEADATGASMLEAAGISTAGLIDFLQRNQHRAEERLSFVSTHPATSERLDRLRLGLLPGSSPALDDATFRGLARACEGRPARDSLRSFFGQ